MYQWVTDLVRCPKCLAELEQNSAGSSLICKKNSMHSFPIVGGIPTFVKSEELSAQDAIYVSSYDNKPEWEDEYYRKYDKLLAVDLRKEFIKVLEKLPVKPSCRILDHSTGNGSVIFEIRKIYPKVTCEFVGVDLSMGILRDAQRGFVNAGIEVPLFHTRNEELPFKNNSFDIVIHIGGINTFHDIPTSLEECARVLKPGGLLTVVDEGLSPSCRKTQRGMQIVKESWSFGLHPPTEHLPPLVKDIEVRWIARDTFYVISCQKLSDEELKDICPLPYEIQTKLSFYSKKCYPIK